MSFPSRLRNALPLLVLVLVIGIACGGDKEDGTPGVVVTPLDSEPGSMLTPRAGVPVDMGSARELEAHGNIQDAALAYVAVAAAGGADATDAKLAGARLLLDLERPQDARILLETFLDRPDVGEAELPGRYLLARTYTALALYEEALEEYDRYLELEGPAAPYAILDRASVLEALDQPLQAATAVQSGLEMDIPGALRRTFVLSTARTYERGGMLPEAIDWYERLIEETGFPGDVALALQRIAALKKILGDESYFEEVTQLLVAYPGTSFARVALENALDEGYTIAPNVRGLIYYRHNEHTRAEPHFREQLDLAPNAPESAIANYYLAAILEVRGQIEAALEHYERVDVLDPASFIADDALWWRGRILEEDGLHEEAAALYGRIVNEYPSSAFAADAAFRHGMLPYRAGDYLTAASRWAGDAELVQDRVQRQRLSFWQAKALLMAGQDAAARAILVEMAMAHEDDYIGVRAASLLGGLHGMPGADVDAEANLAPDFDWDEAERWLTLKTGAEVTDAPWRGDARWRRAQELWRVGRTSYGDMEALALMETQAHDPVAMYTLARELARQGRAGMSARAGQRLLRGLNTRPSEGIPRALLSLSYPAAFGPMVERYAREQGISPLLMLAFIRQESFFNPRAVSPANALGLTQVLPSTAEAIGRELNVSYSSEEALMHADLNVRFGAKYMADQLRRFNGEIFVALAAYNAGPTAAARWRDLAGDDADLYLETVDFAETKLYLELVSENYAMYRYIYGGEPEPNLPR